MTVKEIFSIINAYKAIDVMLPDYDNLNFANTDEEDDYTDEVETLGAHCFKVVKPLLRSKHFVLYINPAHEIYKYVYKYGGESIFIFETWEQAQHFIDYVSSKYSESKEVICSPTTFDSFEDKVKRTGYRFWDFEHKYRGNFNCIEQSPVQNVL